MKERISSHDQLIGGTEIATIKYKKGLKIGDYKRGDLVGYDPTTKLISKCVDVEKAFGIMTSDQVAVQDGDLGLIYVSGVFNMNFVSIDTAIDKDDLRIVARKLNIYFS